MWGCQKSILAGGRLAWAFATLAGCHEEKAPVLPEGGPPPPVVECGVDRPCPQGSACFDARCYVLCSDDGQCVSRESCALEGRLAGLCVPGDGPLPADPCAGQLCLGELGVCHQVSGACVACQGAEHCAGERPVCDRGRGQCVARDPSVCAACNADVDCADPDAGVGLSCVALDVPLERVCVPRCSDGACPPTFECRPGTNVCVPRRGSCTAYRAAQSAQPCESAQACSAEGVAPASPYAGLCHEGHCAFACVDTLDCPGEAICAAPLCVAPGNGDAGTGDGGR